MIKVLDQREGAFIDLLHRGKQRTIGLVAIAQNAFVGIAVRWVGPGILWVVVCVFEPIPTDADFRFEEAECEILVVKRAVVLRFDYPSCAAVVASRMARSST